jgi:hypothetical protein
MHISKISLVLLLFNFIFANAVGCFSLSQLSDNLVCPANGLSRNETDATLGTVYSTNTLVANLDSRVESPENRIYTYVGSIIPAQTGFHQIRIDYASQTSAALVVESTAGNCSITSTCHAPSTLYCTLSKTLQANVYYFVKVSFQIPSCASNGVISLKWTTPSNGVFSPIPTQNLCSAPYTSKKNS